MPNFVQPAAVALPAFLLRLTVTDGTPPTVAIEFAAFPADANGSALQTIAGDLTPYLTPAQINAFTSAALALQAKAKTELLQ